jgi:hypothetical protein
MHLSLLAALRRDREQWGTSKNFRFPLLPLIFHSGFESKEFHFGVCAKVFVKVSSSFHAKILKKCYKNISMCLWISSRKHISGTFFEKQDFPYST